MILRLLTRWNYVLQKQLVVKLFIIVVSNIHFILSISCLKKKRFCYWRKRFFVSNLDTLSSTHLGSQKYVDYIDHINPNYIQELFCNALNIKGGKTSYETLIVTMNQKSSIPGKTRYILSLHRLQLYRWFIDNSGKSVYPKAMPLDTPDHKAIKRGLRSGILC